VRFRVTRHWLELANQWLEVARLFSTRPSHDSDSTRKNFRWLWLDKNVSDISLLETMAWCCCDRKARAASALSFTLWQQAAIEITCHDHSSRTPVISFNRWHVSISRDYKPQSVYYCLFAPHTLYMGVIIRAHPVRGESHIQHNANREVATVHVHFHELW